MNLYEHTIVARQDATASQIKQLTEKYSKIIEEFDGSIIQTQNWGLLNLSYIIKKFFYQIKLCMKFFAHTYCLRTLTWKN